MYPGLGTLFDGLGQRLERYHRVDAIIRETIFLQHAYQDLCRSQPPQEKYILTLPKSSEVAKGDYQEFKRCKKLYCLKK